MQPGLEGPALKAESAYFLSEPAPRRMIRRRAERRRGHLRLPLVASKTLQEGLCVSCFVGYAVMLRWLPRRLLTRQQRAPPRLRLDIVDGSPRPIARRDGLAARREARHLELERLAQ